MLEVEIYAFEGPTDNVQRVSKGTIVYDNEKLIVRPLETQYNRLFRNLLGSPIQVLNAEGDWVQFNPKTDPEGWLRNLHLELRTYALRASEPIEK